MRDVVYTAVGCTEEMERRQELIIKHQYIKSRKHDQSEHQTDLSPIRIVVLQRSRRITAGQIKDIQG